jgi:hypothetical protein
VSALAPQTAGMQRREAHSSPGRACMGDDLAPGSDPLIPLGQTELGRHRFHRMDIHAPRCLNMGAISLWRNDHEKAQYAWDYRWSRVIECDALLASMVAKECGALP